MRHVILSDVHGNLEGLETVLADVTARGADTMVCLGDFVGYGAAPNECIERLRPRIEAAVAGNHDLAASGRIRLSYFNDDAKRAAHWTTRTLTAENTEYLRSLPFSVPWRGARLVHASPSSPEKWHYVFSPNDAAIEMEECEERLCFIGHSHYPGTFELEGLRVAYGRESLVRMKPGCRYLVNVGSVGQPRDGDPRAAYLVWDDEAGTIEHVRVDYDIEAARQRILGAGLPAFLADRLQWGE